MEKPLIEQWTVSNVVVQMRDGTTHTGAWAKLFVNSAGDPKILQVREPNATLFLPWGDVRSFANT